MVKKIVGWEGLNESLNSFDDYYDEYEYSSNVRYEVVKFPSRECAWAWERLENLSLSLKWGVNLSLSERERLEDNLCRIRAAQAALIIDDE